MQNYERISLQKIDDKLKIDDEEDMEKPGEAKLVELQHPYRDARFFLLGVPFTDVESVEQVVNDVKPDYIIVSYDSDRMERIKKLAHRRPKAFVQSWWPSTDLRQHFDVMMYALMCGHHHLDPALEYAKENDVPLYAVDRSEFLTMFRASQATVGRVTKMLQTGKTVKMLSPFLFGKQRIPDISQEFLEDARESLDNEEVDFERQQLMKLPAFGEERGEIFAHRLFYFEADSNTKVLGICQRSLFDYVIPEWGKTTDEDMHQLHLGPNEKRRERAKMLMGVAAGCIYTLPFYFLSAYADPTLMMLMWASIPAYIGISTPLKMRAASNRTAEFYAKIQDLDKANGLWDKWRMETRGETHVGPEVHKPETYVDRLDNTNFRFSPMNFGDLRQQQDIREEKEELEEQRLEAEKMKAKAST